MNKRRRFKAKRRRKLSRRRALRPRGWPYHMVPVPPPLRYDMLYGDVLVRTAPAYWVDTA